MRANSRTAMTMMELLVAMAVLGVIMTAAFPLVDQMMTRFQMSRDHYVAASLCQARIERARGIPYVDLPLLAESNSLVDDFGNLAGTAGRFRRTTTVTPNAPVTGMTTLAMRADICICTRRGWRKHLHPITEGTQRCQFTDEHEEMKFLFTEFNK